MLQTYLKMLVKFGKNTHSTRYKIMSLIGGSVVFLAIVPIILLLIAQGFSRYINIAAPRSIEIAFGLLTLSVGLGFLGWAALTQWRIGKGTPALNAPTQTLIVSGPYQLCRNPIEFGAILYYTGLGAIFWSLTVGVICGVIAMIGGSLYHKLVEEKELVLRFGDEYIAYKAKTPFLIPNVRLSHTHKKEETNR